MHDQNYTEMWSSNIPEGIEKKIVVICSPKTGHWTGKILNYN